MKSLVTIILSFFFLFPAREISMLNIKINDTESAYIVNDLMEALTIVSQRHLALQIWK